MRISKKIATAAAALAIAAGLLAPTASAACPYTVGPLGRYIAPAEVRGLFCRWCRAAMPPGVHRGGSTVPPGTVPGATVPAEAVPGRAALS